MRDGKCDKCFRRKKKDKIIKGKLREKEMVKGAGRVGGRKRKKKIKEERRGVKENRRMG